MGHILAKAESGEAIIMEIKDRPCIASTSFIITPLPCCTTLNKFKISEFEFCSRFCDIITMDNRSTSLECIIRYNISSKMKDILNAYKFVNKTTRTKTNVGTLPSDVIKTKISEEIMNKLDNSSRINAALSVTSVIGDCLVAQAIKMTFKELMVNKQCLTEIAFKTAKVVLSRNGIHLKSFDLQDVSLVFDYSNS